MDPLSALRAAIDLVQVPSRVRIARAQQLPDGMEMLLRVAAGDGTATETAAVATGRDADFIREAATFFVEQVLLEPGADSYRVLGGRADSGAEELRRHVALLMRCLHPDASQNGERSVFAGRITGAWEDLKTPQRRAMYDAGRGRSDDARLGAGRRRRRGRNVQAAHDVRLFPQNKVTSLLRRLLGPRS